MCIVKTVRIISGCSPTFIVVLYYALERPSPKGCTHTPIKYGFTSFLPYRVVDVSRAFLAAQWRQLLNFCLDGQNLTTTFRLPVVLLYSEKKSYFFLPFYCLYTRWSYKNTNLSIEYCVRQRGSSHSHSARNMPAVHPGITMWVDEIELENLRGFFGGGANFF